MDNYYWNCSLSFLEQLRIELLFSYEQVKRFKPQLVSVKHESLVGELKEALADVEQKPEIISGEEGIVEVSCVLHTSQLVDLLSSLDHNVFGYELQVARHPDAVTVVTGIVGCAGLKVKAYRLFLTHSSYYCHTAISTKYIPLS